MKTVSLVMQKGIVYCYRIILSDKKLSTDAIEQHAAMYNAIKASDPTKAREAMFSHLAYVEERLNSHLQGSSKN